MISRGRMLLQDRRLLLARTGQSFLDQPREFFLTGELDLRVFLGHPDRAVAGDLGRLNARPAYLLAPRDVGASKGVRTEAGEIASFGFGSPL